jgi:branched-subunit amino acid aminotransferase/4-amino-4-deoxychorismate lyase
MPEICLINGKPHPVRSASIPIDDWAVRYGWGLFETIRIHNRCPLFLARHLDRLCSSAPLLELGENSEKERKPWERDIRQAVRLSKLSDGIVNCYWTRGSHLSKIRSSRIIRIRQMPRYPKRPLTLWVAPWRIEPTYPGSGAKTLAYFPNMYAGLSARRAGFDEALILNSRDHIADGSASSIFIVSKGRISTPGLDQGTLAGTTRAIVIEIASQLKIRVREGSISWKSLLDADEIFITSSLRGIVSVSKVADQWKQKRVDKSIAHELRPNFKLRVAADIRRYHEIR